MYQPTAFIVAAIADYLSPPASEYDTVQTRALEEVNASGTVHRSISGNPSWAIGLLRSHSLSHSFPAMQAPEQPQCPSPVFSHFLSQPGGLAGSRRRN